MTNDFPFKIDTLLEQCGGNKDIGKVILDEFVIQVADDLKELEACIARGDLVQAGKAAHRLKGTAGVLGAAKLHTLCQTLENAGREGNAEEFAKTYSEFKAEIDRCVAAVPEARGQL